MNERPGKTSHGSDCAAPSSDRGSGDRYFSLLRVGALVIDGRRELCLVRNVSSGGMLIRPYSPLELGTRVSIELKQGESFSGSVQSSDRCVVAVAFDQPIDALALLRVSGTGPQPRMPRIDLNRAAWVRNDGDVYRTRALNISQGGIRLMATEELPIGAKVTVSLPGLAPSEGLVKWRVDDEYGVGFHRILAIEELMVFLRSHQEEERRRKQADQSPIKSNCELASQDSRLCRS